MSYIFYNASSTMFGYLNFSHTEGKSYLAKRNGSAILIGSLRCHGQEDNIGLCKAFMDKETCTDEAVGVDCTGSYVQIKERNLNDLTYDYSLSQMFL